MTRRAEFMMIKAAFPGDRQCGFLRLKGGDEVVPVIGNCQNKSLNTIGTQEQIRAVGGRWDMVKKLRFVPYGCITGTKLESLYI